VLGAADVPLGTQISFISCIAGYRGSLTTELR
jgi:hypothetical protein